MDGKLVIMFTNILAVVSLFIAIVGVAALIVDGREPSAKVAMVFAGLFAYAVLSAMALILMNLVQIRKNTEHA